MVTFPGRRVDSVVRLSGVKTKTVPSGDMPWVEAAAASRRAPGRGYIGSVTALNYFPSASDVKKMYYAGPVDGGVMKWMGMQGYGVRSPLSTG
jgi:hypothetical protein